MADYRIYLTRANGSVISGSDVECSSDLAACIHAKLTTTGDEQAEVWQGRRLIGLVFAAPEQQTLKPSDVALTAQQAAETNGQVKNDLDSWHAAFAW